MDLEELNIYIAKVDITVLYMVSWNFIKIKRERERRERENNGPRNISLHQLPRLLYSHPHPLDVGALLGIHSVQGLVLGPDGVPHVVRNISQVCDDPTHLDIYNNISILEAYPHCIKSSITKYRNIYTMLRQPIATPFIQEYLNIVYINNNAMETKCLPVLEIVMYFLSYNQI